MSYSFLALSGSLRTKSINTEVLLAMDALSPDSVTYTHYTTLGDLPAFNPDDDVDTPPRSVADWRSQLARADAVVICTPEYAHGVPGTLKNALDWVVGSGEIMHKPVALLCASAASQYVGPQLTETLTVMMAHVIGNASVTLPLASNTRDAASMCADREVRDQLRAVNEALIAAIGEARKVAA